MPLLKNIGIEHVDFTLPENPITAFRAVFFHKIDGLNFNYNTLNESNGHTWLQVVGGHDGTNLQQGYHLMLMLMSC